MQSCKEALKLNLVNSTKDIPAHFSYLVFSHTLIMNMKT